MTCAKTRVTCTITADDGTFVTGENHCHFPQKVCPREPGEDYTKCKTICNQVGHAEEDAIREAHRVNLKLRGSTAELYGHTYVCRSCQEALYAQGVKWIGVRK